MGVNEVNLNGDEMARIRIDILLRRGKDKDWQLIGSKGWSAVPCFGDCIILNNGWEVKVKEVVWKDMKDGGRAELRVLLYCDFIEDHDGIGGLE